MKQYSYKGPLLLIITAVLWGVAFAAQALGGDHVPAFTFNAIRYTLAGIVLLSITLIRKGIYIKKHKQLNLIKNLNTKVNLKLVIILTICVGLSLFLGGALQQFGITITRSSSKSGFITSLYIVFVPIIGLLFGRKFKPYILIFIAMAIIGSYLMAAEEDFTLEVGDILTFACTIFFALQIIFIDLVNPHIDPIFLTGIECIVAGILSIICALIFETTSIDNIVLALPSILYAALLSSCVAYTLQVIGQKYTKPSVAPLIMSLESVVALICGVLFLGEVITVKGNIGCILIFIAIILAQLDFSALFKTKNPT